MLSASENDRIFAEAVVRRTTYSNVSRLLHHVHYILGDVHGVERGLDIGGGQGILSFYLATHGAKSVVCVEPEGEGSTEGVTGIFGQLRQDLPNGHRVHLAQTTFQEYDPGDSTFDYIVTGNAINHLNEPACIDLKTNSNSYDTYIGYFQRIYEMLDSGGRFVATDCSRYSLYPQLGLKNPFMPAIEWEKHQSPYQWRDMLMEVGFVDPDIKWTAFNALGGFGRLIMNNPVVSYVTVSHFRLCVRKP